MRFKLSTLLIFVTLVALALWGFQTWKYLQWRKTIPVIAHTEGMTDLQPPNEVRVGFGAGALAELESLPVTKTNHYKRRRGIVENTVLEAEAERSFNKLMSQMNVDLKWTASTSYDEVFDLLSSAHFKRQFVSWSFDIASPDAVDLYKDLAVEFPDLFSDPSEVTRIKSLLDEYGLGKQVQDKFVLGRLSRMRTIQPPDVHMEVLDQAGLYYDVYMLNLVHEQLFEFAAMSRGEVELKHITTAEHGVVAFEFAGNVYQFDVEKTDLHYDPHLIADVLNAILERNEIPNRYIAYWTETDDAYIFYGPPELAKRLEEEFEMKFMGGAQEYFE